MSREHQRSKAAMWRSVRRHREYILMRASIAAAPMVLEAMKASSQHVALYDSSGSENTQTAAVVISTASAAMRIADIIVSIVVVI